MSRALEEMRVNYDRNMVLKNIELASNPLLKRRLERNQTANGPNGSDIFSNAKRRQLEDGTAAKPTISGIQGANTNDTNASRKKSSPNLKRMTSAPASKTPLTAFYYTSNLKGQLPQAEADELFLNSSFS